MASFDLAKVVATLTAQAASTDATQAALAKAALAVLDANKAYFTSLTEDAINTALTAYLTGDDAAVVSVLSLNEQAAAMVAGSADVAQRQYDFKQRALVVLKYAAALIVTILAAAVGL